MALAFDTLTTARKLHKEHGFTEQQAEGVATLIHHQLVGNVATKDDIARLEQSTKDDIAEVKGEIAAVRTELKEDIAAVRAEMVTKHELAAAINGIDAKINGLESRLLKTLVPVIFGVGALLFAALRFLPPV